MTDARFADDLAVGPARLVVLDEFPNPLAHSPELPSVMQEVYDEAQDDDRPPAALTVRSSALILPAWMRICGGVMAQVLPLDSCEVVAVDPDKVALARQSILGPDEAGKLAQLFSSSAIPIGPESCTPWWRRGMIVAAAHLVAASQADHHEVFDNARDILRDRFGIAHAALQVEPVDHQGRRDLTW